MRRISAITVQPHVRAASQAEAAFILSHYQSFYGASGSRETFSERLTAEVIISDFVARWRPVYLLF